jgi:hypothetical protein
MVKTLLMENILLIGKYFYGKDTSYGKDKSYRKDTSCGKDNSYG